LTVIVAGLPANMPLLHCESLSQAVTLNVVVCVPLPSLAGYPALSVAEPDEVPLTAKFETVAIAGSLGTMMRYSVPEVTLLTVADKV
jgi:hypothetical protein